MKTKIRDITVVVTFILVIAGFMVTNIIMTDAEYSFSERRRLASFPEYSHKKLISGVLFDDFEEYFLDQFVFRDVFRGLKAYGTYGLLNKKDNNKLYVVDGNIIKIEYPLNEKSVIHAAEKLNNIYDKYLNENMQVSYAIIPDKNYFVALENGYLSMDYEKMQEIMKQHTKHLEYIDLFNVLSIEDYYNTDIHWKQEELLPVADLLLEKMGKDFKASDFEYKSKEFYPFHGAYLGQAALKIEPDTLTYLTNDILEKAIVYDYESKMQSKVYDLDKLGGMDSYDIYLSGAKPIMTIYNPEPVNDKELILFRDSFGSSIAPLMLTGYSKITLVDIRYVSTGILGEFISFDQNPDVLFLYNTLIINNSYMLK